jgi:hypothetical protein
MKIFLLISILFFADISFGQKKICHCDQDSLMNEWLDCETKVLKNGAQLYWQFNCDRVWLTLQTVSGKKLVIDSSEDKSLFGLTYRIGYQFAREYKNSLLFRYGCAATGPCSFILININNGKKLAEFHELIYDHEKDTLYDFIMYFSADDQLTLHYIDTGKKYRFKVRSSEFNGLIREYQFDKIDLRNHLLTLYYHSGEGPEMKQHQIDINLTKYPA